MRSNLGYCCINLSTKDRELSVNRSMVRNTFLKKGITYASELALKNVEDLFCIVKWNFMNQIFLYRMSSSMIPWMSEYELSDLPDYEKIKETLQAIGRVAKKFKQRLTFHPGPFNVLPSPNIEVVLKTHKELRQHSEIMDLMGLDRSPYAAINIHIGGSYNDKDQTLKRFVDVYQNINESIKSRLVIENDDKISQYSIQDLYGAIYSHTGLPITFDYFHHSFNPGDLSEREALELAMETWPTGIRPLTHFSSSKKKNEDQTSPERAHAEFIYEHINTYGYDLDIEIEAKAKDLALLEYRNKYS